MSIFNHFDVIAPKLRRSMSYSMSSILVPIENSYSSFYQCIILTYSLSCTVSK